MNRLVYAALVLVSCNEQSTDTANKREDTAIADTSRMTIQVPTTTCYSYATANDTVYLKVEKFPNVVTGLLEYRLKEKDRNSGDIDGVMKGDTLVADYRFMSEGRESTRQVMFLIHGDTAIEGYGDMKDENGKMVFTKPANANFSKGMKLLKVDCTR